MSTISFHVAHTLGHVVARVLIMSLVLALVATFALTGTLVLASVLDVTFSFLDAVHDSALTTASLTFDE